MSDSSETKENGCVFAECITSPCPKQRPPKSRDRAVRSQLFMFRM